MFKPFYCCFGLFCFWILIFKDVQPRLFLLEFSGFYILFNLWFSRFFVVVCLSSNSFSISDVVLFVNNFFYLFFWTFWKFVPRSHGASIIIANVELNVNNFFKLFPNFFQFFTDEFPFRKHLPMYSNTDVSFIMSKFHGEFPTQSCWSDLYDKEWRARYWPRSASKESFPRQL